MKSHMIYFPMPVIVLVTSIVAVNLNLPILMVALVWGILIGVIVEESCG